MYVSIYKYFREREREREIERERERERERESRDRQTGKEVQIQKKGAHLPQELQALWLGPRLRIQGVCNLESIQLARKAAAEASEGLVPAAT